VAANGFDTQVKWICALLTCLLVDERIGVDENLSEPLGAIGLSAVRPPDGME